MERFCGHLKRGGAASKRFPYKSLDHYVFDWTTLWHLGAIYGIRDMLKLEGKQKTHKNGDRLEISGREFNNLITFIHSQNGIDNGYTLMAKRPLSACITSEIFLLAVAAISRHLHADTSAVWRIYYALTTATFSEWSRFKRSNLKDMFYAASQYSRKVGARNAQYAKVSHLING